MEFVRSLKSKIAAGTHHDLRDKERREDYFNFAKTVQHGFPAHSSCLAYDPQLDIFAIGTKNGYLKVYGAPGVEFAGQHTNPSALIRLMFLPNEARLISLCEDQTFFLWEIVNATDKDNFTASLNVVKEFSASGKLKKISCWCYSPASNDVNNPPRGSAILLGTESGNIYSLDCATFDLIDYLIYQDVAIQNIPDDYKVNPGPVEALALNPSNPSMLLIGYNRGLIILWDTRTYSARQSFVENFRIESLCWSRALNTPQSTADGAIFMNGNQQPQQDRSPLEDHEYRFFSAHNDGSYVYRSFTNGEDITRTEYKPFGPFPLKPIEKILQSKLQNGEELFIFSGGMPRSSFADKFVVTVERSPQDSARTKRVCFDFTSRVVDFLIVDDISSENSPFARALMILCDEELVAIDLLDSDWPQFRLPYCRSLHCSPITASVYTSDVNVEIFDKILAGSRDPVSSRRPISNNYGQQNLHNSNAINGNDESHRMENTHPHYYSAREWPIKGGHVIESTKSQDRDFLITGHEDGTVKFWTGRSSSMNLLCTLNAAKLFEEYVEPFNESLNDEENWPPFRRVGLYDPYTDDPRFAIQRIAFDSATGILVVGGSAGQVVVFELNETERIFKLDPISVDLTSRAGNTFSWKGREKLTYLEKFAQNGQSPSSNLLFAPRCALQLNPPAALTALACRPEWRLVGLGTAQGFALVDYQQRHVIIAECLLTSTEIDSGIAATEGTVSRLKSFKKSLRESFRRKRHRRSMRGGSVSPDSKAARSNESGVKDKRDGTPGSNTLPSAARTDDVGAPLMRTVERSVEARVDSNCLSSMVRCLHLRKAAFAHAISPSPSFWIGTNGGEIFIYLLNLSSNSTSVQPPSMVPAEPATIGTVVSTAVASQASGVRSPSPAVVGANMASCQLAKHIRLKHAAPVLAMFLVDSRGFDSENRPPLSQSLGPAAATGSSPDHASRLIVVSEEQLKAFHWPKVVPSRIKNKITAVEGSRIRKVQLVNFRNKHDENRWEPFLVVMTNQGELEAFSSQNFRRCFKEQCTPAQTIASILSTVLTPRGEGFYLLSSSEWQRFNVGAAAAPGDRCVRPRCTLAPPVAHLESSQAAMANGEEQNSEQSSSQEQQQQQQRQNDSNNSSILTPEDLRNLSASLSNDTTIDSIRDYTASPPASTVQTS